MIKLGSSMEYAFSKPSLILTALALPLLGLAYFVNEPGWLNSAPIETLPFDLGKNPDRRIVLFLVELAAWSLVLMTHILLVSTAASERKLNCPRELMPKALWIALEFFLVIVVLSYHANVVWFTEYESPVPRLFLAIFSLIVFRQLVLTLVYSFAHLIPETISSLKDSKVPDNFFGFGRRTRRRTGLSVVFMFLVAVTLVVWSPSLLPKGLKPQFIALGVAVLVTFPSIILSFYVQLRLLAVFDDHLEPIEKEISNMIRQKGATGLNVDRVSGLVEIRAEVSKVAQIPWIAVVVGLLQALVAVITIVTFST